MVNKATFVGFRGGDWGDRPLGSGPVWRISSVFSITD